MGWLFLGLALLLLAAWASRDKARRKRQRSSTLQEQASAAAVRPGADTAARASPQHKTGTPAAHVLERHDGSMVTMSAPNYRLSYLDSSGSQSQREVVLLEMDASSESFQAYCFLRSAERTFRFDSVLQLVDLRAGELIPVGEVWRALNNGTAPPPHLGYPSSSHVADALVCFARDELNGVKATLRAIILEAMRRAAGDAPPGDDVLNTIINRRSRSGNVNRAHAFLTETERDIALIAALDMVRASRKRPDPELLARADDLFS